MPTPLAICLTNQQYALPVACIEMSKGKSMQPTAQQEDSTMIHYHRNATHAKGYKPKKSKKS
jgi:hypothetical protein